MRVPGFVLAIFMVFLAACTRSAVPGPIAVPRVSQSPFDITRNFITATASPILASPLSQTATPSLTSTPTPTPTPTAPAMIVLGNPRGYTLFDPVPQSGAPCGWVDTLDFPLNPPHGEAAYGGGDYGVYRERYEKYHAGEDWGLSRSSNFGQPVYSIGHGQVTYAQPVGWGADKGVVIVRHAFSDGDMVLSFYGHLDPPSVTLREGECVQRGDIVGQIGRPRTPPHLHFEMRVHLPYATGSGYWPSDPTQAGWWPPSQTISQYRLQVSPGVIWMNAAIPSSSQPLGELEQSTFLLIEDKHLVGIDIHTGDLRWSYELSKYVKDALIDPVQGLLYVTDTVDGLLAYSIPTDDGDSADAEILAPLWEQRLSSSGRMDLMPLPAGQGVLVSYKEMLSAFSPQGELLWEEEQGGYLASWDLAEEALIFTTSDEEASLMSADAGGLYIWSAGLAGIPLVAGDQTWLYAQDGFYQLDLVERTTQRVYALPNALMRRSTAKPSADGGVMILHTDTADRRLLLFDAAGQLVWEFSIPLRGNALLFELDGKIYLFFQPAFSARGNYKPVEILAIDLEQQKLMRIFEAGSRVFNPRATWVQALDGQGLLIHIGGGGYIFFDPEAARKRMGQ